ncbi:hypothetical protein GCWU000341_00385 [Oribacterium sp. oral taxon 078 str. F0262]|nr:hypothetical protein GCWU000341_00385 [Oribacterium sp. oral taxon 078 str. F0262]
MSREAGSCEAYRTEQDPEGRTVMLRRKNAGASWHSAKDRKRAKRKSRSVFKGSRRGQELQEEAGRRKRWKKEGWSSPGLAQ